MDPITKKSKAMTYVLRHHAEELGVAMDEAGFVRVADLLESEPVKRNSTTEADVREVVDKDSKGRFELANANEDVSGPAGTEKGELLIRAVQGHSIKTVEDKAMMKLVDDPDS